MQKIISLKLLPSEANDEQVIKNYLAKSITVLPPAISGYTILKQSIDARGKQAWINMTLRAYINEPYHDRELV